MSVPKKASEQSGFSRLPGAGEGEDAELFRGFFKRFFQVSVAVDHGRILCKYNIKVKN